MLYALISSNSQPATRNFYQKSDYRKQKIEVGSGNMEVGKIGRQIQVLFLPNQLIQPCQLNQPYIPALLLILLHLPLSGILLYAPCPNALITRNPQPATRIP